MPSNSASPALLVARLVAFSLLLTGCGGSVAPVTPAHTYPAGLSHVAMTTVDDAAGGPCAVSTDGFVWYALPAGAIPPIDFTNVNCVAAGSLDASAPPPAPAWSVPSGSTQTIFIATSLQETYSLAGMQAIEGIAEAAHVPVTWMIGNSTYLTSNAAYYDQIHASNGDDVELEVQPGLYAQARQDFPWFSPTVSVDGAGRERNISGGLALGNGGFWGITWNSHGTDDTSDEGAPWGTYCADVASYKRPSPTNDCSLVSFEWTARDLTRAYLTNTNANGYSAEAAFSSDPDDLLMRGGFSTTDGSTYARRLVDAYAAAGVGAPLVMMSQQESAGEAMASGDNPILSALYQEAVTDGMKAMTLHDGLAAAKAFSARPRAIAFPFIPGGNATSYDGVPFTPATIDYHDSQAGMTFLSGHTLPSRVFEYAADPVSTFDAQLAETLPTSASYPKLVGVTATAGGLTFSFQSPAATHFGIAIWSDPAVVAPIGANVVPAGHAGFVVAFDLPAGASTQTVICGCASTTLPFAR